MKIKIILVKVKRLININEEKEFILKLIPKKWSGNGILGCKINCTD